MGRKLVLCETTWDGITRKVYQTGPLFQVTVSMGRNGFQDKFLSRSEAMGFADAASSKIRASYRSIYLA